MAKMDWLGFRGPSEMLAERFHMDEDLLNALNPDVNWSKTETEIIVVSPGENRKDKVARVIIDRSGARLLAYDVRDELVVAYPATIGSSENSTPSGLHQIKVAIKEATYSYNPDINFQQGVPFLPQRESRSRTCLSSELADNLFDEVRAAASLVHEFRADHARPPVAPACQQRARRAWDQAHPVTHPARRVSG